ARTAPVSWTKSTTRSRTDRAWRAAFTGSAIRGGRISHPVAEKVERQYHEDHGHGGAQKPPRAGQHLHILGVLQQDAPTDRRRTQSEAKKAERRLADDHHRQGEADRRDDMARERRKHVAQDDTHLPGASEFGGDHEVLLTQRQEPAARDARPLGPTNKRA